MITGAFYTHAEENPRQDKLEKNMENLLKQNKYREALSEIDKLIKLDPDNSRIFYYKSMVLKRSGPPEEAAVAYKKSHRA